MQNYMRVIILLAFSSFCMGVAEFIISGILPSLSKYFSVKIGEAGNLATLYALGVVIGAPILSVVVSKWNYKIQLSLTLMIFCLGNLVIFFSQSFALTLVARFICGLMHGLFFVIATIVTIKVAPANKVTMALSLMVSGLTIALVTGIPLGIFLSEHISLFFPFLFISGVSFLVTLAALIIMPNLESKKAGFKNLTKAFKFPPLICGFLITAFTCGSQMVLYIYLRVFLEKHGFSSDAIKQIFLFYGVCAIVGNIFGGRLADTRGTYYALSCILISQIIIFASMSVTHIFSQTFIVVNIAFMAFFGFASIAPLKTLSTFLARSYTPKTQSDTIAINEGAFNVGIALASLIGGLVEHNIGINFNGLFAALFSLCAVVILAKYIKRIYLRKKSK